VKRKIPRMEATRSFGRLVSYLVTTRCHNAYCHGLNLNRYFKLEYRKDSGNFHRRINQILNH